MPSFLKSKLFLYLLALVFTLFLAFVFIIVPFVEKKVKQQIASYLPEATEGYTVKYSDIELSIFPVAAIEVKNFYLSNKEINSSNNETRIDFSCKGFKVSGFSALRLLLLNQFYLNKLEILNPDIKLYLSSKKGNENRGISQLWSENLKEAQIDQILFDNGKLRMIDVARDSLVILDVNPFSLFANGSRLAENLEFRLIPFDYDAINLEIQGVEGLVNSNILIESKNVTFYSEAQRLSVYDPAVFPTLPETSSLVRGVMDSLIITGFDLEEWLIGDTAQLSEVQLFRPQLTWKKKSRKDDALVADTTSNKQTYGRVLFSDSLLIHELQALQVSESEKDSLLFVNKVNLNITNGKFIETSSPEQLPIQFAGFHAFGDSLLIQLNDGYNLRFNEILWHPESSSLKIDSLHLYNSDSRELYFKKRSTQTDYFSGNLSLLSFTGLNLDTLNASGKVILNRIELKNGELDVSRDKRLDEPIRNYQPLLITALRNSPIQFIVDTLVIDKLSVTYHERTESDLNSTYGSILFANISGQGYNLRNYNITSGQDLFSLSVSTQFLSQIAMSVNFLFYLNSTNDDFKVRGKLVQFQASALNELMLPLAAIKFESGKIDNLIFSFNGNENRASGELIMPYQNLKLAAMKTHSERRNLSSLFSNALLIRSNNFAKTEKVGAIEFERWKNRSFFHYSFNALKSGITDIMLTSGAKSIQQVKQSKEK